MKIWNAIRAWWLERKVLALYVAYDESLRPNIYEGVDRWGLPKKTLQLRDEFNAAVKRLQKIKPGTTWKTMN